VPVDMQLIAQKFVKTKINQVIGIDASVMLNLLNNKNSNN
jgi:hypothetical protein